MTEGTAVATWDPNSGAALPAYLADAAAAFGGSNIPDRMTVPSLSYEGKVWQSVINGNRSKFTRRNEDGDDEPVAILRVVLLNCNQHRGRAYYPGVYDPAKASAPKCWSADGVTPDSSITEKENPACQGCPQSIKGSKIQDGKEMVACSQHRMLALVPASDLAFEPLRLKIAVTSDYDKEIVEHGWFALRQYLDYLKSRGIVHTGLVVTKMKFDPNVAYPKILFSLDRPLDQGEVQQAVTAARKPEVAKLLAETWTAAGVDGTVKNDSDISGADPITLAEADGWVKHPTPGYYYKGQEVVETAELVMRYVPPAPAASTPPAPEPAPAPAATPAPTPDAVVIEGTARVVETPATAPTVETVHVPLVAATADGWLQHPTSPEYYYRGQEILLVADLEAKYPAPAAAAPVAPEPPAPPAPPAAPAPAAHDPHAAALADGWVQHPQSEPHGYKGQEVLEWAAIHAKYPGNAAAAPAAPASEAPAAATGATGQSPSEAIPADVQNILDAWTSGT